MAVSSNKVARLGALISCAALLVGQSEVAHAGVTAWVVDGDGRALRANGARASLSRRAPAGEPSDPSVPHGDPDALAYLFVAALDELPSTLDVQSLSEDGRVLSQLRGVPLAVLPCPEAVHASADRRCAATPPIRAVADEVDAGHPLVKHRSVVASLGGVIALTSSTGAVLVEMRVAGPRKSSQGPIERIRAKLRFVMVRLSPSGSPPMGGDEPRAKAHAMAAIERANALWGACGISFGPPEDVNLELVDPPPAHLLSVGCEHSLPASGGSIAVAVMGRVVEVRIEAGVMPDEAARRMAAQLERAGMSVRVFDNPHHAASALGSSDISVRLPSGALASLEPPRGRRVSSDATLGACIGHVDLEDGLQHFGDVDAAVGTIEERALLLAYDDQDSATIDVFMVPSFARGGRIGESFIGSDGGTIRNVVIVDRAGVRSSLSSFTLAHELGHVIMDDPGHPDDFGIDTPTRLMDADASDPSAFGPRRIAIEECERALVQSGPGAAVQLLVPWALAPVRP